MHTYIPCAAGGWRALGAAGAVDSAGGLDLGPHRVSLLHAHGEAAGHGAWPRVQSANCCTSPPALCNNDCPLIRITRHLRLHAHPRIHHCSCWKTRWQPCCRTWTGVQRPCRSGRWSCRLGTCTLRASSRCFVRCGYRRSGPSVCRIVRLYLQWRRWQPGLVVSPPFLLRCQYSASNVGRS
jgi:hypothetical protein